MKQNRFTSQIIIFGVIVIGVFVYVATINLINGNSSNNFYASDKKVDGKIDNYYVSNNKLIVEVSGNIQSICVKTTRSIPENNSICWNDVVDSRYDISVFEYKSYYIWIRDVNGNVSDAIIYNPKEDK